jgi:RES domain-containing protein
VPELPGFRLAAWDTPLRVNPNRSAGRFNRENSPATQYIGLHPLTPWAEYLRTNQITSREAVNDHRIRIWAIRVVASEVTTIDFENAPNFGLDPHDLISDDWTACQDFADRLREDAAAPKVLQVPSAALAGTRNVVILGERVDMPYLWTPIDDGDLPTCVVVEEGRPPEKLLDLVRYEGQGHAEFEAWSAGRRYEFADLRIHAPPP